MSEKFFILDSKEFLEYKIDRITRILYVSKKYTMSTDEVKNDESIEDDGSWITVLKKKKREVGVGVVTEDHPVVKKILEFIEKEIWPIENDEVKHDEFNEYLNGLSEMELVIYAVYVRISSVPAIYKYDGSVGLSVDDFIKVRDLLEYEYLILDG